MSFIVICKKMCLSSTIPIYLSSKNDSLFLSKNVYIYLSFLLKCLQRERERERKRKVSLLRFSFEIDDWHMFKKQQDEIEINFRRFDDAIER